MKSALGKYRLLHGCLVCTIFIALFVFLEKMQPGGLFQVNEATNVFFMILRDCFITENAINLSPQ